VGCLIDAAGELARIISGYKRDEIDARIAEIEQSDLSDPAAKKQAFAEMAKLKEMRDQLGKQVRWTFPQWKVTGE
jgi:predicted XRE-type DNA-binding protein